MKNPPFSRFSMRFKNMRNLRFRGFTLVELLVAVSVIATLAVVAVAYGNSYKEAQYNERRLTDVATLETAADAYFAAKNDYPEPTANRIYYDQNGAYSHSSTGAYGVSSVATSDMFWNEFLPNLPLDPATDSPYGYGKRKDGTAGYDFAGIDRRADGYYAYVRGTYDASSLPSLVREYNGPSFVEDGSADHFPYNPFERKVSGRIASYSGTVSIVPVKTLTGELIEGDSVRVRSGGIAILSLSDGSEIRIGSTSSDSELKLEDLEYGGSKGLLTKVRLALVGGEAWAKAPKLRDVGEDESTLEMSAGNAIASVRGTIFWMKKGGADTVVTLAVGKLQMTDAENRPITIDGSSDGTLEVADGSTAKKITVPDSASPGGSTLNALPETAGMTEIKKGWNAEAASKKIQNFRIVRDSSVSGGLSIFFRNDLSMTGSKFVSASVERTNDDGVAVGPSRTFDSSQSNVRLDFSASETFGLREYPEGRTDSNMVSLPLEFCYQNGKCVRKTVIIPKTGEFSYDEETLPEGWKSECPKGTSWFLKLGCQPNELVGFAPYQKEKDLYMYARSGKKLPIATAKVAAADALGDGYRAGFWRDDIAAPEPGSAGGYRTTEGGLKGVSMDSQNPVGAEDYLFYDLSELGIDPKNFAISVDVAGTSLIRPSSAIENDVAVWTRSPDNPEKGAFLWAMEDGYSLYLKTSEHPENLYTPNWLILLSQTGGQLATARIDHSKFSPKRLDRFIIRFDFSGPGDKPKIQILDPAGNSYWVTIGPLSISPSRISKISIGSNGYAPKAWAKNGPLITNLVTLSGLPQWWVCHFPLHCQWGGDTEPNVNTSEIIDSVRIFDLSKKTVGN